VALMRLAVSLLGLSTGLIAAGGLGAQDAERSAPEPTLSRLLGEGGQTVAALVDQLRKHPAEPSSAAGRVGLYLIGADGGEATLIASELDPWLNQCGSPVWSPDGRRIFFDATPGIADFSLSRIKSLELDEGHLSVKDLGPGNCLSVSASCDRLVFLLNPGAVPGAESSVWLMNADGTGRRKLGGYGRPRWSPDGHQFLVVDFSSPAA
jgi:Tol biopolymer transport system component